MEIEACFSGYCRNMDAPRMVFCTYEEEAGSRRLTEAGCSWPDCVYAPDCPLAREFTSP